ncbi:MAG: DNA repair protein RecN [Bacteroidales bacterium]|nr:DNA repair protein RecN [Bacteroidales bacterium]
MLNSLHIRNYALISSLQIRFDKGLTVITGETGAGKSIIMGALSLILGHRADTSTLFDQSEKCVVEAVFDVSGLHLEDFFTENNLDYQDDTIVRREIAVSGKSRAFINDTPVTLPLLKEFTSRLIDIHSQHQNLLFQNADFRTDVVDLFAGIKSQVAEYQKVLSELKDSERQLSELKQQHQAALEKQDFLQFVVKEIEEAHLKENEQEELEQNIEFLTHTETIKSNLFQILQILSDEEPSAVSSLREAKNLSAAIASYRADLDEMNQRINSSYIELKDIANELNSLNDRIEYNADELEAMRQRLDFIYSLEQKHHLTSVSELLNKYRSVKEELDNFSEDEEQLKKLTLRCQQLQDKAHKCAVQLHQSRNKVLPALQTQVLDYVHSLGMHDAQFVIKLETSTTLLKNGIDEVKFLFSANRGVEVAELEKVASGGEISRLMLAVKSTLSEKSVLPTVVFDEIDVGISGEMAGKVAALMQKMAQRRQLLVITHLPQIAAKGNSHYLVYKEVEGNTSRTKVTLLDAQTRAVEIAKMMSGEKWGEATLKAAQELIEQ